MKVSEFSRPHAERLNSVSRSGLIYKLQADAARTVWFVIAAIIRKTMEYTLKGFTHNLGVRVYEFEGMGQDRVRIGFRVSADLDLIRKYGIRVQDLPLLCRSVLELRSEGTPELRAFTYTEEAMTQHAADSATERSAAALKKKTPRKPVSENTGSAWRGLQVNG